MTINTNHPPFNSPEQQAQLLTWWPNGKIEMDYMLKQDRLLIATGNRMKDLVRNSQGSADRKTGIALEETPSLAVCLNLIDTIRQIMKSNPAIPASNKEKMSKLDSQGTLISLQVSLDKQLRARIRLPMKALHELGKLRDE